MGGWKLQGIRFDKQDKTYDLHSGSRLRLAHNLDPEITSGHGREFKHRDSMTSLKYETSRTCLQVIVSYGPQGNTDLKSYTTPRPISLNSHANDQTILSILISSLSRHVSPELCFRPEVSWKILAFVRLCSRKQY